MEANTGPKQFKCFPQSGKVQDGNTGNHQNIPPAVTSVDFKDAYFHILIQEQSRKYLRFHVQGRTYQFKALPFHSAHGVHCISQRGETDGHTQGYKNPPVPRRLVGESQISTPLSPTHPNPGQNG